ncbi:MULTISPECIES: hypothetical protein [Pseudomonas]|uniref:hypothetical protein n=1 Tax=Pseudomonas TaxID=286 RepID=UPI00029A9AC3|nr:MULTISPECIES: hypothetical protein [Pseudomonas]MBF4209471.1 hypothetical protein [Pseudomonas donghuensis]MCP6697613.1 hypothetical protein [Pseudomonas donghuensis]PJY93651.1 hypothetical protein COO64_25120 [Pseudomonas donghuensis]QHF28956.1 hypothetical protein PspR32_14530 [Pseudomonas sp. R32]UVL22164.1 hypothetical protein LOY30_14950 [Pseudomonas donghuensis]
MNSTAFTTCLLALCLALLPGCSSKPKASYQAANAGSNCHAKAVPSAGEGGLAWGATLQIARQKSMNNCMRYAGRSGGLPATCKVVLAECKR